MQSTSIATIHQIIIEQNLQKNQNKQPIDITSIHKY